MRIAFFTEVFLPKVDGIVTRLLRTLEELRDAGHEAIVFAPGDAPDEYAGHKVVRLSSVSFKPVYPELKLGFPSVRLQRELRAFAPDVIHAVNPFVTGLYGVGLARATQAPLVASYHTDITQYTKHLKLSFLCGPTNLFTKAVHEQANLNLCTSNAMVGRLRDDLGVHNVRLWPMGVDTARFHPKNASPEMRARLSAGNPDAPLALYVGRLSHEKRLGLLEETLREIPDLRLAFVGRGPAEAELLKQFADYPVEFLGYLHGDELSQAYASADFLAFPSDTETLGFAAMEAMASGLPAVGANAGGLPEVITDGEDGLLFKPGDASDLHAKIAQLIADPTLRARFSKAARSSMEQHSWTEATKGLVELYETIAAPAGG